MRQAVIGLAVVMSSVLGAGEVPLPPARVPSDYGRLPLRFERNDGQVDRRVRYLSRGPGYTLFVTPTEMALSLRKGDGPGPAMLQVRLLKSRAQAEVEGLEELPGRSNYFIGNDPRNWRTSVAAYARVRCRGVYPGIDLVYKGSHEAMEYDFVVAPGADPGRIRLALEGARGLRLDEKGNLVVRLEGGEVIQRAPRIYQDVGSRREAVRGRWVLRGKKEAGFELGAYDRGQALVIDPILSYSTYLGGGDTEQGYGIAVDDSGSAYLTGYTRSTDFPSQNPYQTNQPADDVFVTKLSPSGNSVVYSTYLGGAGFEIGYAIAVDSLGSAYVTGATSSIDFPTQNPYQTSQASGDAFVTKLSPSGSSLAYSTYLGGNDIDYGRGIAVDSSGSAFVTGSTFSTDFPTHNPYQTNQPAEDVFVTKLSPPGNSLVYSTYLGGRIDDTGYGIAVDSAGSAFVTGSTTSRDFPTHDPYQTDQPEHDAFVTKLSPQGNSLVYSTYLGGGGLDEGLGIAVDGSGSAYVTGWTQSADFPTQNPYQTSQGPSDVFVTKFSPPGNSLVYSTYLGGSSADAGHGIAVDGRGSATVAGRTHSTNFPTMNPYQTDQPVGDAFVTRVAASGNSLIYSTYLGGNGQDDAVGMAEDALGSVYLTGTTTSTDFPTQSPYQGDQPGIDSFVTKLALPPMDFFTLTPCRLIDTRNAPGPYGGPALAAGTDRTFAVAGQCGISPQARAVAVNIVVTAPSTAGNLRLHPAGTAAPLASSINYAAGQTRANNAIVALSTSGMLAVDCAQAAGTTHFILDVNGYFE